MIDPSPRRKKVTQKNFPIPSGLNIVYHTADGTAIRPPRVMNVIEALCAAECLVVIAMRSLLMGTRCQRAGRSRPTAPQPCPNNASITLHPLKGTERDRRLSSRLSQCRGDA